MNLRVYVAILVVATALAGCAVDPQRAIAFAPPGATTRSERIGVAMTALPKADTYLPGTACLLCAVTASMANSGLNSYTRTLTLQDLPTLKLKVADLLRKKGVSVVLIDQDLDVSKLPKASTKGLDLATKNYSSLGTRYDIDHLIVIDIWQVGFERAYSTYFPYNGRGVTMPRVPRMHQPFGFFRRT